MKSRKAGMDHLGLNGLFFFVNVCVSTFALWGSWLVGISLTRKINHSFSFVWEYRVRDNREC